MGFIEPTHVSRQNKLSGTTLASIEGDSDVTATISTSGEVNNYGISVVADDATEMQAVYEEVITGNLGASALASATQINADGAILLNQSVRDASAKISHAALTTTGSGDIRVTSDRSGAADATARVTTSGSTLALGGVIAENRLGYDAGDLMTWVRSRIWQPVCSW